MNCIYLQHIFIIRFIFELIGLKVSMGWFSSKLKNYYKTSKKKNERTIEEITYMFSVGG